MKLRTEDSAKSQRKIRPRTLLIAFTPLVLLSALISTGIAISVMRTPCPSLKGTAKTEIKTLHIATMLFLAMNPGECPSVKRLIDEGFLEKNAQNMDPWGRPYIVTCTDSQFDVFSTGPDQSRGTQDDVR